MLTQKPLQQTHHAQQAQADVQRAPFRPALTQIIFERHGCLAKLGGRKSSTLAAGHPVFCANVREYLKSALSFACVLIKNAQQPLREPLISPSVVLYFHLLTMNQGATEVLENYYRRNADCQCMLSGFSRTALTSLTEGIIK